jgi:hypothetical protein
MLKTSKVIPKKATKTDVEDVKGTEDKKNRCCKKTKYTSTEGSKKSGYKSDSKDAVTSEIFTPSTGSLLLGISSNLQDTHHQRYRRRLIRCHTLLVPYDLTLVK